MAIVTDDIELLHDFTRQEKLKKKLDWLEKQTEGDFLALGPFSLSRPQFGRSKQYSALMATLNEAFEEKIFGQSLSFRLTATKRSLCAIR